MIKGYLYLFILALVIASCKKEELPVLPDENGPYYHIAGLVNDDSINWEVGVDNTWISYGQSSINGVDSYYGQITSGANGDAIRIEILRPEIYSDGTEITAFNQTSLEYLVHQPGAIKFNFGMNYEQFNYVLIKNQNDLFESASQVGFDEFGLYNLCVKFSDFSLTNSFILPVRFGFEDNLLNTGFTSHGEGDTVYVQSNAIEGTHEWFLDGALVSQEAAFHMQLNDGIYQLKHKYKDNYGNEGSYTTLIRFKDQAFYWQMRYYYMTPSEPSSHYGNVLVSMQKDGVWYRSEHALSNLENKFNVSNITTFISLDQDPSKTTFDFLFTSVLWNDSQSDSLYLPEMSGRMGIEFK